MAEKRKMIGKYTIHKIFILNTTRGKNIVPSLIIRSLARNGSHGPLIGLRRAFVSCSDSFLPSSRMMRGGRERMELFAG